jgi:hypothetical protein
MRRDRGPARHCPYWADPADLPTRRPANIPNLPTHSRRCVAGRRFPPLGSSPSSGRPVLMRGPFFFVVSRTFTHRCPQCNSAVAEHRPLLASDLAVHAFVESWPWKQAVSPSARTLSGGSTQSFVASFSAFLPIPLYHMVEILCSYPTEGATSSPSTPSESPGEPDCPSQKPARPTKCRPVAAPSRPPIRTPHIHQWLTSPAEGLPKIFSTSQEIASPDVYSPTVGRYPDSLNI